MHFRAAIQIFTLSNNHKCILSNVDIKNDFQIATVIINEFVGVILIMATAY